MRKRQCERQIIAGLFGLDESIRYAFPGKSSKREEKKPQLLLNTHPLRGKLGPGEGEK